MNHSTGKPNKLERKRLDALSRLPCMCCVKMGIGQKTRTEVHHLVDKGTRKLSGGHSATIPLCAYHHRGTLTADGTSSNEMASLFGPSLAINKKAFLVAFGSERDLLKRVDAILEMWA